MRAPRQRRRAGRANAGSHLEVLRNLAHEALEGQLADEQLRRLLVAADLAERDGTRAEAVGLLDTTGRGRLNRREARQPAPSGHAVEYDSPVSYAQRTWLPSSRAACAVPYLRARSYHERRRGL
jgi:hypothetical protein